MQDIQSRLRAREAPQARFCWHCRKPLHARSDRCPFCGESAVMLSSHSVIGRHQPPSPVLDPSRRHGFRGTGKIWMNGKLVDWKDATIHIAIPRHPLRHRRLRRRALLRHAARAPPCFRLDAHMRRLIDSCQDLPDGADLSTGRAGTSAVLETIRANGFKACYIRPLIYRGYDSLGVNPLPCPVDAAIMVWEWGAYLGADAIEQGRRRRRQLVDAPRAEHVSGAGEGHRQLRQLRADQDGGDARRLRRRHRARRERASLSEGSGQNLFLVRDGVDLHAAARLVGAAGHHARHGHDARQRLGFEVREKTLPREMLYLADEAFFCGTAVEITPIRSFDKIDGRQRQAAARSPRRSAARSSHLQRRAARHARLADVDVAVDGRAAPSAGRRELPDQRLELALQPMIAESCTSTIF